MSLKEKPKGVKINSPGLQSGVRMNTKEQVRIKNQIRFVCWSGPQGDC